MKKLLAFILLLVCLSFVVSAVNSASSIQSCTTELTCPENDSYCVFFFYGEGCPHCAQIEPLIKQLESNYANFKFHYLEIYYNSSNQDLFNDFVARYNIERPGVPAVFIGSDALLGTSQIEDNLKNKLDYYSANEPVCPLKYNKQEASIHEISPEKPANLTMLAVIGAALADSINPCAFAVLAFLLLYVSSVGSKKRMLKVGFVYIVTVYVVYFLSGLGIFSAIQSFNLTRIVYNIAAIVLILAGLIEIKDFFWYGKGISLAIPQRGKPLIEKYIHIASIPAAIVLGVIVSLFELPCTGAVYFSILSLLASKLTMAGALPWLLLYNLIFVLPLFVILLGVYFGISPERVHGWSEGRKKFMRLALGLIMIALGLAMLFQVI